MISADDILKYCIDNLDDVVKVQSWRETGIFYNPNKILKRGVYVLTIKEKDGATIKAQSLIDRGCRGLMQVFAKALLLKPLVMFLCAR